MLFLWTKGLITLSLPPSSLMTYLVLKKLNGKDSPMVSIVPTVKKLQNTTNFATEHLTHVKFAGNTFIRFQGLSLKNLQHH